MAVLIIIIIIIDFDLSVNIYAITVPAYFQILISKLTDHDTNKLPAFD